MSFPSWQCNMYTRDIDIPKLAGSTTTMGNISEATFKYGSSGLCKMIIPQITITKMLPLAACKIWEMDNACIIVHF